MLSFIKDICIKFRAGSLSLFSGCSILLQFQGYNITFSTLATENNIDQSENFTVVETTLPACIIYLFVHLLIYVSHTSPVSYSDAYTQNHTSDQRDQYTFKYSPM